MTIHYYENDRMMVRPNVGRYCAGCGEPIYDSQRSERIRVRDPRRRFRETGRIEVRHVDCRPDWLPKVKRKPRRDAQGRFASAAYTGPTRGQAIGWRRLSELPVGSLVRGMGNYTTYEVLSRGRISPQDGFHEGYMYRLEEMRGEFKVLRVGDRLGRR